MDRHRLHWIGTKSAGDDDEFHDVQPAFAALGLIGRMDGFSDTAAG